VRPGALGGTHDGVQSGRGAAMISFPVRDPDELSLLARRLTAAFLRSGWRLEALAESGAAELGWWPSWLESLALSVLSAFRSVPAERQGLETYVSQFLDAHVEVGAHVEAGAPALARPQGGMLAPVRPAWPVAQIESVAHLADRLELSAGQLAWLADVRGLERTVGREQLRNYRYAIVARRGGVPRVIEAPKLRLKEIQRWILREILVKLPEHAACHGFTQQRSVLTNARPHVGQSVVLGLDLRDFFASVAARRVFGIFQLAGYRRSVAHALTGLCTNVVAQGVWARFPTIRDPLLVQPRFWLGRQLATPHLPQGAPTSPALANLIAFRLDRRLTGLAEAFHGRYSRYADDLTFSGPDVLRVRRSVVEQLASEIARDEGFVLHPGKSRLHTGASRQTVCGVVVNVRPNVVRAEYEELKAILHNAERRGPAALEGLDTEDMAAYLRGRIAWVGSLNPRRGEQLLERYRKIDWTGAESSDGA
jgi:RNA-directed DNA polymerase